MARPLDGFDHRFEHDRIADRRKSDACVEAIGRQPSLAADSTGRHAPQDCPGMGVSLAGAVRSRLAKSDAKPVPASAKTSKANSTPRIRSC